MIALVGCVLVIFVAWAMLDDDPPRGPNVIGIRGM